MTEPKKTREVRQATLRIEEAAKLIAKLHAKGIGVNGYPVPVPKVRCLSGEEMARRFALSKLKART